MLHRHLISQIEANKLQGLVEIVGLVNDGKKNIGEYRNGLINQAKGEYVVFIDDDDWVADSYVADIVSAINTHLIDKTGISLTPPDVITFRGWMTTNGQSRVDWIIKVGEDYCERDGKYYRYPNHLCPIKKKIALMVPFKDINHGEDYQWATALKNKDLLKTSVHIDKELYHYRYTTNK